MGSLNTLPNFPQPKTHGGSPSKRISPEQLLRRSVLSCLLWEKEFYEDGENIASRILETAKMCSKQFVSDLAVEARHTYGLRHVPLLLVISLIERKNSHLEHGPRIRDTIEKVIHRPDELCELLAIYWRKGRGPISKQLQRGLAQAFRKFSEYQLAKYNRDTPIKLRDVLFLSHAKPRDEKENDLFARVAKNELKTPDTWEVELSAGKDKKETFERLLKEGKLGYLALLRNLRNMEQAGCDENLVKEAILAKHGAKMIFPFRYIAAARHAPRFEPALDKALLETIHEQSTFSGKTIVLVDISGSMTYPLSGKSDLNRMDAACALASLINGDDIRVFSFSNKTVEVPHRLGMAGADAIWRSQPNRSTRLSEAIEHINKYRYDRLIVVTDEQSTSNRHMPKPQGKFNYMINVASYKKGVGYGSNWIHLDGFSEAIIRYIQEYEKE